MKIQHAMALAFLSILISTSAAKADLGNCMILRDSDSRLDGQLNEKLSKSIQEAYSRSNRSDSDMVFVLSITGDLPGGGYTIGKARLVLGESWTLHGYKISAHSEQGLQNGVQEINQAFAAGKIDDLKQGKRSKAIPAPQYVE
ncbi:MAG: hypothetical protein COA78_32395 [Blastopirellula sp.]|nr:MAG: hypothetical protein COA78_32395 [Blastopirellula sp.]